VGVAGLAVLGRPALGFGRVLDDPVAGLRAPASLRTSSLGAAFTTTAAARRGVPGFRPKRPLRPGSLMGAISIPSIGLADDLREGIDLFVLDQGPGHWAGSATPGEVGNCIIAGHRVSHTHPFYDIDAIPVGAEMVLSRAGIDHVYVATSRQVVSPTATDILDPTTERTATIFACHPRGSIAQRFVVQFTHAN
jgi:LPXTG-site transpeptidase (sortase) family protein